jgi:hypothetical protein
LEEENYGLLQIWKRNNLKSIALPILCPQETEIGNSKLEAGSYRETLTAAEIYVKHAAICVLPLGVSPVQQGVAFNDYFHTYIT